MRPSGLEEHIQMAYDLVKRAGIQEELLAVEAFKFALASLEGGGEPIVATGKPWGGRATVAGSPYEAIAAALGVPAETVEVLFDVSGDELRLNLPVRAMPASNSAAMREIAVLLTVGRKYAGLGGGTPFELIRTACDEYGKLDKKNFAAAMGGMRPRLVPAGKGTERELIAKKPADDLAKEIVTKYSQRV